MLFHVQRKPYIDNFDRLSACGVLILFVTSLPVSLEHGAGLPGLVAALTLVGLG